MLFAVLSLHLTLQDPRCCHCGHAHPVPQKQEDVFGHAHYRRIVIHRSVQLCFCLLVPEGRVWMETRAYKVVPERTCHFLWFLLLLFVSFVSLILLLLLCAGSHSKFPVMGWIKYFEFCIWIRWTRDHVRTLCLQHYDGGGRQACFTFLFLKTDRCTLPFSFSKLTGVERTAGDTAHKTNSTCSDSRSMLRLV